MSSWAAPAAYLLGIGWYFAISILLGVLIGHWADDATGLKPIFTLIGIALGLVIAIAGGIRMVMRFQQRFGAADPPRKE